MLARQHIVFVVYGVVDERTKRNARYLVSHKARVTILSATYTREDYFGECFQVNYVSPGEPVGSDIKWRPGRIVTNSFNNALNSLKRVSLDPELRSFGGQELYDRILYLEPDLIVSVNADTLAASARAASDLCIPFIYEAYEFWPDHAHSKGRRNNNQEREAILHAERTYIKDAEKCITVSPFLAREYKEVYELEEEPIVIPNAPPHAVSSPSAVNDPLRVLFLGNFRPEASIEFILGAAKLSSRFKLTLQGQGPLQDSFVKYIEDHRLTGRVKILPPVAYENVVESASAHDVGVVSFDPYDRQHDGALPNKFYEYMSGGLAIVTPPTTAFNEFENFSKFGTYFDVGRGAESLASVLNILANNPDRVEMMKQAALRESIKYGQEAVSEKLARIYQEVLSTKYREGSNR